VNTVNTYGIQVPNQAWFQMVPEDFLGHRSENRIRVVLVGDLKRIALVAAESGGGSCGACEGDQANHITLAIRRSITGG